MSTNRLNTLARARIAVPAVIAVLAVIASCSDSRSARTLSGRVDTLPGGIVRTINTHPIDSGRWSLVRERDIQPPANDSAELLEPADVALADDGSVLVAETKPAHVKVFDRDGRFVRSIGREGSGPGEFRAAWIGVRGDTLVVQDPRNTRATMFNFRTGAMLSERRTACCYWHPIAFDGAGRAVARTIAQPRDTARRGAMAFVRFALSGSAVDTVFVGERAGLPAPKPWEIRNGNLLSMTMPVPLQPSVQYAVDRAGGFVTGWTGEYSLRTTRDGRDTVSLFGREFSPGAVSAADKSRIVEERIASMRASDPNGASEAVLRKAFDASLIPATRPAYVAISVDAAGRRWVRLASADTSRVVFDLFDSGGRWLDVVSVAASDWPREAWGSVAWGAERAAVILEGADGRPMVRVFRVSRR